MTSATSPPRTALCLCGGGITGGMFEIGALAALDDFFAPPTGEDTRAFSVNEFDLFVGTSAGAFLATVLASGMPIKRLFRGVLDDDRAVLPGNRSDIFRFDV